MSQTDLADKVGVVPQYINCLVMGSRIPGPEWVNTVSAVLGLDQAQACDLHRAAATAKGYILNYGAIAFR